ncbi:MAG: ABC transporter ATP-binding protein [Pseudomonadota bacterium]
MTDAPLVQVDDLHMHFTVASGGLFNRSHDVVKAVNGVSFDIAKGETFGLVGESGCGKTTIGRCLLKLEEPTAGSIRFNGQNVLDFDKREIAGYRKQVQAVFQDPFSSLNPRMSVEDIVGEPFLVHGVCPRAEIPARVRDLLSICGLPGRLLDRYPHEMSGGQRQRVGIARALALKPDFIVCDEAVSALDVSIQAQIISLLESLRAEFGLTYLFIAHDLSVVRHICHRVAVMYLGRIVEIGESESLFANPLHPYTRALLDAVPTPDPQVEKTRAFTPIEGEVPSPMNPPSGCVFHPRCPTARESCTQKAPDLLAAPSAGADRSVACPVTAPASVAA